MKVFASKRSGNYSGGLIVVAANNKFEAAGVLALSKQPLLSEEYVDWYELPNLTADVDEPQIIDEGGYTE